jgi:hypothetical protein
LIITLIFEKNANFFAESWQKPQKMVIITLTPEQGKKYLQKYNNVCFIFSGVQRALVDGQLSRPRPQVGQGPRDGGRRQEGQPVGRRQAQLHHGRTFLLPKIPELRFELLRMQGPVRCGILLQSQERLQY